MQADGPALSSASCTAAAGALLIADVIAAHWMHLGFHFRRQAGRAHHRS